MFVYIVVRIGMQAVLKSVYLFERRPTPFSTVIDVYHACRCFFKLVLAASLSLHRCLRRYATYHCEPGCGVGRTSLRVQLNLFRATSSGGKCMRLFQRGAALQWLVYLTETQFQNSEGEQYGKHCRKRRYPQKDQSNLYAAQNELCLRNASH